MQGLCRDSIHDGSMRENLGFGGFGGLKLHRRHKFGQYGVRLPNSRRNNTLHGCLCLGDILHTLETSNLNSTKRAHQPRAKREHPKSTTATTTLLQHACPIGAVTTICLSLLFRFKTYAHNVVARLMDPPPRPKLLA